MVPFCGRTLLPGFEAAAEVLDEQDFRSYLRDVVPHIIGGSEGVLENVLEESSEVIKRFIQEGSDQDTSGAPSPFVVIRNIPDAKGEPRRVPVRAGQRGRGRGGKGGGGVRAPRPPMPRSCCACGLTCSAVTPVASALRC